MDVIVAAALIAVGIVVAAAVYARVTGGARAASTPSVHVQQVAAPAVVEAQAPLVATAGANGGGEAHSRELVIREERLRCAEGEISERVRLLERQRDELVGELERISGLSAVRARQLLIEKIEDDARQEAARRLRQIEDDTRRDAERRVRNILAVVMQRLAAGHATESTVSVVQLAGDELKGRIIGREGRNIRVLETLTGVDFIIDDTPGAVVLSGFDGVRREIARLTLERLLQDGRIHPARIEEVFFQVKSELESHIIEAGEQGAFDAGVQGLHQELVRHLGRLKFRTSYGQNVLAHSVEVAQLAAMMASELGASAKTARRAALLHDIGKAVTHEVGGAHALIGAEYARKYGVPEKVANIIASHHGEEESQSLEAVLVSAADAISGARPGARRESLEQYLKRVEALETMANAFAGVQQSYAIQAGREIRIIVKPEEIDDLGAINLCKQIARRVEDNLEYPGQIKVTVVRETRSVEYAK